MKFKNFVPGSLTTEYGHRIASSGVVKMLGNTNIAFFHDLVQNESTLAQLRLRSALIASNAFHATHLSAAPSR